MISYILTLVQRYLFVRVKEYKNTAILKKLANNTSLFGGRRKYEKITNEREKNHNIYRFFLIYNQEMKLNDFKVRKNFGIYEKL